MTWLEELELKAAGAQHNFGAISCLPLEALDEMIVRCVLDFGWWVSQGSDLCIWRVFGNVTEAMILFKTKSFYQVLLHQACLEKLLQKVDPVLHFLWSFFKLNLQTIAKRSWWPCKTREWLVGVPVQYRQAQLNCFCLCWPLRWKQKYAG